MSEKKEYKLAEKVGANNGYHVFEGILEYSLVVVNVPNELGQVSVKVGYSRGTVRGMHSARSYDIYIQKKAD